MGKIRYHRPQSVHFVTNSCEHRMFFLLPCEETNHLIKYWLARAKVKYGKGLDIYGFIFMSNHFHMMFNDAEGDIAQFMSYFTGNLARSVNRKIGRSGRFWISEYNDKIIEGDEAFLTHFSYLIANPVKSGLVGKSEEWRGVSSYTYSLSGEKVEEKGLNITKYNSIKRYKNSVKKDDFMETFSFELAKLPLWSDLSQDEYVNKIRELSSSACNEYNFKRGNKKPLGMKKVMEFNPLDRPEEPSKRESRMFACNDVLKLKELMDSYKEFVAKYRDSLVKLYRHGITKKSRYLNNLQWPEGSYPPTFSRPVTI